MWFAYFAAPGAGVAAGVAVGVAEVFTAFLVFFTCFFATGALLSVEAAGACAASDRPAVASARESPITAEVIFFMMFVRFLFFEALCFFCLCTY
jgi:hypothetical protein